MGVFQRIADVTKASVHELLDKLEDPVMMLNQYLRDMEEEIAQAEVTVAKQMANQRRTAQRASEWATKCSQYEEQAKQALAKNNEDAARQALAQKIAADKELAQFQSIAAEAAQRSEELSGQLQDMKESYYNMRNKRNELAARAQMAETSKQMAKLQSDPVLGASTASRGFERMEERIMQMEIEADMAKSYRQSATSSALGRQSSPGNGLDDASKLAYDAEIEAELAALKEKI